MKKIIFSTDLDRTLLFAGKAHLHFEGMEGVETIGYVKEKPMDFMSKYAIELLKDINKNVVVIPNTIRPLEKLQRLSIFKDCFSDYSVLCNGGKIMKGEESIAEWDAKVLELTSDGFKAHEARDLFLSVNNSEGIKKVFDYSPNYVMFTLSETLDKDKYTSVIERLESNYWEAEFDGKKVHLVHKNIDKNTALKYLAKLLDADYIVSAGDSKFDTPMLLGADLGLVPKGTELYNKGLEGVKFTESESLKGSEEILETVLNISKRELQNA